MRKLTLLLLATMFSIIAANAQGARILGYLPDYRDPNTIQYNKVTDVVFSFMNPNTNGTIIKTPTNDAAFSWNSNRFTTAKNKCQANGVSLWVGVGGQDDQHRRADRLNSVCGNNSYRATFTQQLIDYAKNNGAFGVIIDWEFPETSGEKANHLKLMQALYAYRNTNAPNLKIGIAVGGEYKNTVNHIQYVDPSLFSSNANLIDEWHIMAYDFPSSYGSSHSSLSDGKLSAIEWEKKGVPASKMLLAVPFYARNSVRNAINYNQLSGSPATNFNNDVANGYHYNGKATLEAKTKHIIDMGGQGVVIWDLGQDRTDQYSLLNVIYNKMQSECNIAKPNLGPDAGVCNGQTVTLESGVPAASGLTFSWTKDGQSVSGSGTSLTVSTGGDYEVTISNGSCSKTDLIKVVSGSSVSASGGSGCRDQDISLSVNNVVSGKTYDWYDAAVGGNKVSTGATYTYTPDKANDGGKAFSFFVEEKASGTESVALGDDKDINVVDIENIKRALLVDFKKDATIKDLTFFATAPNTFNYKIQVLNIDQSSTVFKETAELTFTGDAGAQAWNSTEVVVDVNLTLPAGKYWLTINVTGDDYSNLRNNKPAAWTNRIGKDGNGSTVVEVAEHAFSDSQLDGFVESETTEPSYVHYGQIEGFNVQVGASTSCGRAEAVATVEDCLNFQDLVNEYGVSVVPNPSSNEFTFSRGSLSGDVQVNVLTTSGDVVFSESVSSSTTFGSELAAGVYVVQIVNNGDVVSTKVVKQ